MHSTADVLLNQDKNREAESVLVKVVEARRRALGNEHPDMLKTLVSLGRALIKQRRHRDAVSPLREATSQSERTGSDDWNRYSAESLLRASLTGQKDDAGAKSLLVNGYEGLARRQERIPPIADLRS